MGSTRSTVHILLPVHNRRAITEKFVNCLAGQTYANYHLVLIDDGSTDGTSEMVRGRIVNLTVLTGKGDWWWAGSLQQGVDWLKRNAADDDIAVFINDDVTFAPDFLLNGVRLLDQHGGMVLPQVLNEETGNIEETGVEADLKKLTFRTATSPERINCLPTRGLFMRMSVLRKVGGFFPRLLPHYLSDYEFTIRAHRLGIPLTTSPGLTIAFDKGATGYRNLEGESFADFLRKYFSIKSASNPIYWSTFVLLASPKIHIPWLLTRVWVRSVREIFRQSLRLLSGKGSAA
jgi:GT2 family glycosyltransferase